LLIGLQHDLQAAASAWKMLSCNLYARHVTTAER